MITAQLVDPALNSIGEPIGQFPAKPDCGDLLYHNKKSWFVTGVLMYSEDDELSISPKIEMLVKVVSP